MPIQTPNTLNFSDLKHRVKNHTLFLIENTCTWLIQGIRTSPKNWHQSRPLKVGVWAEWDRTNAITVKAWMDWIRDLGFVFCFLVSYPWDEKKTLVISVHLSVVFFKMDNATCPLHGCIGWVRHLWPSGDWEPVFACRESRSKQARDRPRWSVLDSACWARRQILS